MMDPGSKRTVEQLLEDAGVRIDGDRPFDMRVNNPGLYDRLLAGGSLALGESYMDGWWDCEALDQFFARIMAARLDEKVAQKRGILWAAVRARLRRNPGREKAFEIGERHYDLGNDLFESMLDRRMNYSCAFWHDAEDLDSAQEQKLALTCRKLILEPGMRLLDIGCGWGALAGYAAQKHDVQVTGLTVSRDQVAFGRKCCKGLSVRIEFKDYRDVQGIFDRVVSIGMFEHVCAANYPVFMSVVHRSLVDGGVFLLHTIGRNESSCDLDPWVSKYIFPNSMLPSAKQITDAAEPFFVLEDWHSLGEHYDRTLMAWHENFTRNWESIRKGYGDRFYRMWTYYLLSSAGTFRARRNQLWQIVFSKGGLPGGYASSRLSPLGEVK